jgi:tripartite-type tricarboxylate transporter receptor subunit TctC
MTPSSSTRAIARTLVRLTLCVAAATSALLASTAGAQPYPNRPIRLVVPYAPGGAGDVIARIVSQRLGNDLGTSVVVENKPGAGGMIGAQAVASSPADGYTVLLGNTTEMVVGPYLVKNASYETQRDFKPVALAGLLPQLLITNPSIGAKTLPEFIALARAKPGTYSYATAGTGSTAHIAGALLEKLAGVKLLGVPYKGGAQAVAAVLAQDVSIYFSGIPPAIPHVKTGRLVALGVAQPKPVSSLPEVTPLAGGALQRLDMTAWFGFFVPKDTPADVVATLHAKLRTILDSPEVRTRLVEVGVEPASMSAAEFDAFVASERRKYGEFLAELGIKAE